MSELKPCPFCGSKAEQIRRGNDHTRKRSITIKCTNTMCRAEQTNGAINHDFDWLENVAADHWNTRPAPVATEPDKAAFQAWLRQTCFQKPTPEAEDLAWKAWKSRLTPVPVATVEAQTFDEWLANTWLDSDEDIVETLRKTWNAALAAHPTPQVGVTPDRCLWNLDLDGFYNTGCGQAYVYEAGTPEENGVNFCQHCGKAMQQARREG